MMGTHSLNKQLLIKNFIKLEKNKETLTVVPLQPSDVHGVRCEVGGVRHGHKPSVARRNTLFSIRHVTLINDRLKVQVSQSTD